MGLIQAEEKCAEYCLLDFQPICAGPPGSTKDQWETLANPCVLTNRNCRSKTSKN